MAINSEHFACYWTGSSRDDISCLFHNSQLHTLLPCELLPILLVNVCLPGTEVLPVLHYTQKTTEAWKQSVVDGSACQHLIQMKYSNDWSSYTQHWMPETSWSANQMVLGSSGIPFLNENYIPNYFTGLRVDTS